MTEADIIQLALGNLEKNAGIKGTWQNTGTKEVDGKVELKIDKVPLKLYAEIKDELRNHQLPKILEQAQRFKPLIVVANRIFPKIKEELRKLEIAYLETNGNVFIRDKEFFLWLEINKPIQKQKESGNRAFTKTGLKVLFHFLLDEHLINLPYREIARFTGVALGNVNYVMNGLKEMNFLIKVTRREYRLYNKKEMFDKWAVAYEERLKPTLKVGTFKFLKEQDFLEWKKIPLKEGETWWGGEPGSDLYTDYLKPQIITLYTTETRNELIKNYRLIPDENGNVRVYKRFWLIDTKIIHDNTVPPLLIYADLINTNDRRCIETAQKLYEQYLQDKF